jgi:hypothetical protein
MATHKVSTSARARPDARSTPTDRAADHAAPVETWARDRIVRNVVESLVLPDQPSDNARERSVGGATAGTRLNRNNLPLAERAPEISSQLIVLEHLFQAAREKGSGAVPTYGDADWDAFWLGLERIVKHVRLVAEDIYAQGRLEGG